MTTTRGPGHAKCSCGAIPDDLGSAAARKRWHRRHQADVSAAAGSLPAQTGTRGAHA